MWYLGNYFILNFSLEILGNIRVICFNELNKSEESSVLTQRARAGEHERGRGTDLETALFLESQKCQ